MTGLQLALLAGTLLGLGLVVLLRQLLPFYVDPADFAARTSPTRRRRSTHTVLEIVDLRDRIGVWATRVAPQTFWQHTPNADLELLAVPVHRHYGRKVTYAALGLVFPSAVLYLLTLGGFHLPAVLPAITSLALGILLFFVPDLDVRADAKRAREEMVHALTAYIDLIALHRKGSAGARQAMNRAAGISRGWVFRRIAQELRRSEIEGQPPWEALRDLARRINVSQLDDIANIMALSERSGARVYDALRSRSASMRSELLNTELANANATSERLTIPITFTAMAFIVILLTPWVMRLFTS